MGVQPLFTRQSHPRGVLGCNCSYSNDCSQGQLAALPSLSQAAAQAVDTLAVGMSWNVGSASEHPCFRALIANGDINLTLTQVRPARRHTTLTTNLQSPEASKTTQVTE